VLPPAANRDGSDGVQSENPRFQVSVSPQRFPIESEAFDLKSRLRKNARAFVPKVMKVKVTDLSILCIVD
jgi:hypothetical protein